MSWQDLFDADRLPLSSYLNYPMPKGATANNNVKRALQKISAAALKMGCRAEDVPAILDVSSSRCNLGIDICPCLTHSHCKGGGYYSMQHGAPLRTTGLLRLQGFTNTDISTMNTDIVSPTKLNGMIGNAFSKCVLTEVLKACLWATEAAA